MNIFIDSNIIIDVVDSRKEFKEISKQVMEVCYAEHNGFVSANTLTNIFYYANKKVGADKAKQVIIDIVSTYDIISVLESVLERDCMKALRLPMPDFEDALVVICAERHTRITL
ncbi:MAG: PIN domain-containing protein [Oscillospiraceae bacterium]|nr:PIN domain-containing protein [Oscillospiraceae bacterium]